MKIGVFTQWIKANTIEELAQKIRDFELDSVVLDSFPGLEIDLDNPQPEIGARIKSAFEKVGVEIVAIGGYSNLIHPDPAKRAKVHQRFLGLIKLASQVGAKMVCSETGTFHPASDWDWDPANVTDEALEELVETVRPLALKAKELNVQLGFEPYVMNIAYDAKRSARFIEKLGLDNVTLVADPAGLLNRITLNKQAEVLPQAFTEMEPYLGLVHVEDCLPDPNGHFLFVGAGKGQIDYPLFMEQLIRVGYEGPFILEHLQEEEVAETRAFVIEQYNKAKEKVGVIVK
ncbi:sugar phosphate isomerase/epimerase family protein [Lederbergia graminis]|uniref:Sugar phosphate isomerase/epimerase family protein n=1 Tax=Lederbergia graminis TaxID=735518 RepID=A0ABW0LKT3_9BACI